VWDPAGFALVGYLGHFNELGRAEALPAHHASLNSSAERALVVCSDGVSDYVGDTHPEVASVFRARDRGRGARRRRADPGELANVGGGGDNASCIVARIWQ
jgi:serine/threonine protein phosphatase PrpC